MKRRLKAFLDAMRGVFVCLTQETHGRFHVCAAVIVVVTAFFLDASLDDWCWFVGCIGAVIATESINSSIERLANRVSMEHHDLIRDAKDLAAGAVLVVSVASAVIGMMRMYPLVMNAIFT